MTTAKTMAEVLAEHQFSMFDENGHAVCTCDETIIGTGEDWEEYTAHQAAALTAAGFGLVADAKRAAWDEGHRAGWSDRDDDAQAGWTPSGYIADTPNPYRKASNDDQ